jgi:hypothetical protein
MGPGTQVHSPTPATTTRNGWATCEELFSAPRNTFYTQTELYLDPLNKSLHSHTLHSLHLEDAILSSNGNNAPQTWHASYIANPEYGHDCMRRAMAHAITKRPLHRHPLSHRHHPHPPTMETHTPYRHFKYTTSPYTHHLYTLNNDANTCLPPTNTSARMNTSVHQIGGRLPLPGIGEWELNMACFVLHWELNMANLMRTSSLPLAWHVFGSIGS